MSRTYDVVVWGATGYTGRMVVQYLQSRTSTDKLRWCIAGRDERKLRALKATDNVIVASTDNASSLDAMCGAARSVIACAGPFAQVGMPVAEACVRQGTHYIDVTGEGVYVRHLIQKLHERAITANVVMVPCSGFDCVPSDVLNAVVHRAAATRGTTVSTVESYFMIKGGRPSGGTMASILNIFSVMERPDYSPVSLNPPNSHKVATPMRKGIAWTPALHMYSAPFVMSAINERIVRRSNALERRDATYSEAVAGRLRTAIVAMVVYHAIMLLIFPPCRWLLRRFLPTPGTGPSDEETKGSRFRVVTLGTAADGTTVRAQMQYGRDAYRATALFAVETAACVLDKANRFGVLTPSTAGGERLVSRLQQAGVEISVA